MELEKMTDIESVLFLAYHIENPCVTEVNGKIVGNVRYVYLGIAEKLLPTLENSFAAEILQGYIDKYK